MNCNVIAVYFLKRLCRFLTIAFLYNRRLLPSQASEFGVVKIDSRGRISQFSEKPRGVDKKSLQIDTFIIGLSAEDALKSPYIASMGVYVFKTDVLLKLLKWSYPNSNDFESEVIPAAVKEQGLYIQGLLGGYWDDQIFL